LTFIDDLHSRIRAPGRPRGGRATGAGGRHRQAQGSIGPAARKRVSGGTALMMEEGLEAPSSSSTTRVDEKEGAG
jgi:hypothetical protein